MLRTLSLFFLCACTSLDVDGIVRATGPYAAGHQATTLTYNQAGTGESRTLPVQVWYPAIDQGETFASYAVAELFELDSDTGLAAPEVVAGVHPVLVYSHGSGGYGSLAYPFAHHFASHGWVVVSPDHVGNTAADFGVRGFLQPAIDRPIDVREVLDALERGELILPTSSVDTSRTAVMGHSFGGYTTFRLSLIHI